MIKRVFTEKFTIVNFYLKLWILLLCGVIPEK